MLPGLPQQRNGPAVSHYGENHDAETVPKHRGVEGQMQGVAWVLPVLDRPENEWAIEHLHIDAAVSEPALTAPLPAGSQAVPQRQTRLPAIEIDGLAQQEPGHHPGQEHQMTVVNNRAVLTEEGDQLSMEPGTGCHGDLVWFRSPTLSWLHAHPID
jgi:hypothetical protein